MKKRKLGGPGAREVGEPNHHSTTATRLSVGMIASKLLAPRPPSKNEATDQDIATGMLIAVTPVGAAGAVEAVGEAVGGAVVDGVVGEVVHGVVHGAVVCAELDSVVHGGHRVYVGSSALTHNSHQRAHTL